MVYSNWNIISKLILVFSIAGLFFWNTTCTCPTCDDNKPNGINNNNNSQELKITFTNTTHTRVKVTVAGMEEKIIDRSQKVEYTLKNPGDTVWFEGEAMGDSTEKFQGGTKIRWKDKRYVKGKSSFTYDFKVSPAYFFLYFKNSGSMTLGPIIVNYMLQDYMEEKFVIEPGETVYALGYYPAHLGTQIRAAWRNGSGKATYWAYGREFSLPFTDNQSLTLVNTY